MTNPTIDLGFTQGDHTWTKLRARALDDLHFFCAKILGFADVFPIHEGTHRLFCDFLQRRTGIADLDLAPIQKLEMPRGTGKTSCGTVGDAIHLACANPNIAIMIANERQETADGFLSAIKSQFETNDLLRALFPEVIPPDFKDTTWAASKATLVRSRHRPEPTFMTIGVGGTATGTHPDVIIVDDPISKEAMENARVGAWQIMERVNRWCNALKLLLNTQAKPFPWIRFNGTRWWQNDTYDYIETTYGQEEEPRYYRLSAKLADGSKISRVAYRVGQLAVFRVAAIEDGVPMFPEIHSMERLAELRADDPELFAANMMNNPTHAAVRTFQDGWLRYYERIDARPGHGMLQYRKDDGTLRHVLESDLRKTMTVDPAFTASGTGARSAIIVTGTDAELNRHLVLEAIAERVEPRDLVTDLLETAKRFHVTTILIETVAQQAGFIQFVQNEARAKNLSLNIESVPPGGRNKDVRIEALSPYFKAGQILVHRSQMELLGEYTAFRPGAKYKDLLDALAYAAERWPLASGWGGQSPAARSKMQLDSYLARRGLPAA